MSEKRIEPFVLALNELRTRLRRGDIPLDQRLAAAEIAAELGLSATPVREALSRLAGEGLLDDRRGEGFFVRRLSRADIAALYRLSLAHLSIAADAANDDGLAPGPDGLGAASDPVEATERLFAAWAAGGGSRALILSYGRLQAQLGATRRLEPRLLEDLREEAEGLMAPQGDRTRRLARLRVFFARRVRLAGRLSELLERSQDECAL
jgi:hypothetical protein